MKIRPDPPALQLSQRRAACRGLTDPVVQPGVLVQKPREFANPLAQLAILAEDRLAPLTDDSDKGQIGKDRRARDEPPGDEAITIDLGLEVVRELVELGDRDDPGRARCTDRQVDLQQAVPVLALEDVFRVGQVADVSDDGASGGLAPLAAHVELPADQLGQRAVQDPAVC